MEAGVDNACAVWYSIQVCIAGESLLFQPKAWVWDSGFVTWELRRITAHFGEGSEGYTAAPAI